jgi:two-component system, LytTR family, sensor histidine kinase AlgZ
MTERPHQDNSFLPNFCSGEAVLALLLIMQMLALLLLAGHAGDAQWWERLLLLSLYLHWIGLCSAAVLCGMRSRLADFGLRKRLVVSYLLLLLVAGVISEGAWQLAQWLDLRQFLPDHEHAIFLLRNLGVCAIVAALTLRYFWLQAQWRGQVRAESEARYQALQARIRPHFLFNSLNSIAALIASRPDAAETAVEDLAQLFRAGLGASNTRIPLHEEMEVTRAYLRTESLRLGERLRIRWVVEEGLEALQVPPLCLQPLVENAVTHGIEPLPEGGAVEIAIKRTGGQLRITVENPVPAQPQASEGLRSALDNIRQRLELVYEGRAELATQLENTRFTAQLRMPVDDARAPS